MTVSFYGGPFDGQVVPTPNGVVLTLQAPDGTWHQYRIKPTPDGDMIASWWRQPTIQHDRPTS